ncbi:MAG: type II toxin-antitoxin system VapC family toxin [Aggregatilineales bacterium]
MKYLLDTHIFIWLDSEPTKLSAKVADLCSNKKNQLFLSIASVWEMQIKIQLGKLTLPASLKKTIIEQQTTNAIQLLPIELKHVLNLSSLPNHHKDPFDRMLIAQARAERVRLVSNDPAIAKYGVTVVW